MSPVKKSVPERLQDGRNPLDTNNIEAADRMAAASVDLGSATYLVIGVSFVSSRVLADSYNWMPRLAMALPM